jgi:homoserine O-acetyltransferase
VRILSFNLLGSCYGSSGPADAWFPRAQISTLDQARSILLALDALGIDEVELCTGGSLGALVTLVLAQIAGPRVKRIAPIAGAVASSAWVVGWNHVARRILELDPGFPDEPGPGLAVARQLALLTYRAEEGLDERQPVGSYLDHQGQKLARRFDGRAYLALLGAMDTHDLGATETRAPGRVASSALVVGIDSDQLFFPGQSRKLAGFLRERGCHVEEHTLRSPHGHDAFLIEWDQVAAALSRALELEVRP